jgi:hypothetical protein
MAYGSIKVDNIVFTNGGVDQTVTVSGIVQSISGNITATGTIQGATIIGTSTVSGATVTGNVGVFTAITGGTAGFTTVTGATVTGTTATFATVSGTTVTGTTADFGGVITAPTIRGTTTVSGATVTGTAGQFTTVTGGSAGFTTVTGATVTGTTANFTTLSGTTITGGHVTTASGTYTGNVTAAAFIPTGSSVPTNGVYLPSVNNVAISTNGTGRLFVDSSGRVGIGASPTRLLSVSGASVVCEIQSSNNDNVVNLKGSGATNGIYLGTTSSDDFVVVTGASVTERFRITSTGSVNITGAGFPGSTQAVSFNGSAPVNSLVVDSGGRLGLGTSSPNYQLHVTTTFAVGASGFNQQLTFGNDTIQSLLLGTGYTPLKLNPLGGNVGIGTTSPGNKLTANTSSLTSSYDGIALQNNSTPTSFGLYFAGSSYSYGTGTSASDAWLYSSTQPISIMADGASSTIKFSTGGNSERARIDSSGRLLVGTSTARANFDNSTNHARLQVEGTDNSTSALGIIQNFNGATSGPRLILAKSNGSAVGSNTIVAADNTLGAVSFQGNDGSEFVQAASIFAAVDGTPGANDMPCRIVLSVTADGASTPTEAFRITNDRVRCYNQAAPAAVDTTATLTVGNLKSGIITSSTAAAVTMTLPTGTDTEAGFSGIYTNMTFEWTVINTGATNAVTVQGGTGHTLVGSGAVAAGVSGRFASRRTASNTFVTYRLS